jgi:hypothetical protein
MIGSGCQMKLEVQYVFVDSLGSPGIGKTSRTEISAELVYNFFFEISIYLLFVFLEIRTVTKVDKAKINVISSLPYPLCVREVCSFLGHASFYRRFIKDF